MLYSTILEDHINKSVLPISLEGINKILFQMKFSVCKIHKIGSNGTGFFCNLPYKSKILPFLITNNHVLDNEDLKINKYIKFSINNEFKNIKIDEKRIVLTNKELDFTLIEIRKDEDNIDINNFLDLNENINIEEQYLNEIYSKKSIYTIHYPKDENVVVSFGLINQIYQKDIEHLCITERGSSGAPILSLKDFKVIGIHYGTRQHFNFNKGTFIKYIITELNKYDEFQKNNNINQQNINNKFIKYNNNISNQNANFENMLDINENKIKINDEILKNNDINKANNNNEFKILSENSIMAFPNENNCDLININFNSSNGKNINIIIQKYKTVKELFNIYSNVIGIDINDYNKKFLFSYNAETMKINDQRPISQVFRNHSAIAVILF